MFIANAQKLSKIALLAATLVFTAPVQNSPKPLSAYYESTIVNFVPEGSGNHRVAALGPWNFGQRLNQDKPLDKRLNLYVVLPGSQYRSVSRPEYDHNLVVNSLTHEKAREWDIYWCLVLDPKVGENLRSEHELLAAAQQSFYPADLFDLEDVPAREVLVEKTDVQIYEDLRRYRHKDGTLPRILILPARLAVRATAEQPEEKPQRTQRGTKERQKPLKHRGTE